MRRFSQLHWRILAIGWACVMWIFSTGTFRSERSQRLADRSAAYLLGEGTASPAATELANDIVRKASHVFEYAVLACLLYLALERLQSRLWDRRAAISAILLAIAYGAIDEFHQYFVPKRGASIIDVGIDSMGATLGIWLLHRFFHRLNGQTGSVLPNRDTPTRYKTSGA
ncbi:hypothetical protein F183_A07710 [Bryobacterales bacterium F-183]|nr:hypothetical protein F183_A07710 [Bryobacterales bacterium F-183]